MPRSPRVAEARGVSAPSRAPAGGREYGRPRIGFLGEPRVNVLKLNLALDAALPRARDRDRRKYSDRPNAIAGSIPKNCCGGAGGGAARHAADA